LFVAVTAKLPVAVFVPDIPDPGKGTVKRVLESGIVRYATFKFESTAMAAIGEGVVSETRTTCRDASVTVKPVGIAETTAHPSCTTKGGAPT
jgi:uncharacterized membrane protein